MKQQLSIVALGAFVFFVTACDQSSENPFGGIALTGPNTTSMASASVTPSPTPVVTPSPTPVADDLNLLNGTQLLATGIDATANSGTPANCASQLAFLPKKLKGWVIAFGIISASPVDYSYCSAQITCTAGEQYALLENFSNPIQDTIADFEAGSIANYQTLPFTCPQSGNYTIGLGSAINYYSFSSKMLQLQLIKMPSQTVVDTEYVLGGYY